MPQHVLHCRFCEQISSRPQGLAAHIRNRHPKQYPKWLKTPTRLDDARNSRTPASKSAAESDGPSRDQTSAAASPVPTPIAAVENPTLDLLRQVHGQLLERKQSIEADLVRLNNLTKELEAVNTQLEALDKTLGLFQSVAS